VWYLGSTVQDVAEYSMLQLLIILLHEGCTRGLYMMYALRRV
jgi:hypothetical protein